MPHKIQSIIGVPNQRRSQDSFGEGTTISTKICLKIKDAKKSLLPAIFVINMKGFDLILNFLMKKIEILLLPLLTLIEKLETML